MSLKNDKLFSDAGGEQWEVISSIKKRISLKWKIDKFSLRKIYGYPEIRSPTFNFLSCKWYFSLYPNGIEEKKKGSVSLYLEMINPKSETEIKFKSYFKDRNDEKQHEDDSTEIFNAENTTCGGVLIDRKTLLNKERRELLFDDILTVCCELRGWENVDNKCQFVDKPAATKSEDTVTPNIPKSIEILLKDLDDLFKERRNCDVTLQVGDETFPAHKCLLIARSKIFAAMFEHDMKESGTNTITITDIEGAVVSDLLRYIYSGNFQEMSVEKAIGLYLAADKYDILELKAQCSDFLRKNLSEDNICDIAVLADAHNDGSVIDAVKIFASKNTSILTTEKWKLLAVQNMRLAYEVTLALALKKHTE